MPKPPEEGLIWEWRAFGSPSPELTERIRRYPIRMGILDCRDEDLYLISPSSDHNVKIRISPEASVLKFKLLISACDSIEQYREGSDLIHPFPINRLLIEEAAKLLDVTLDPSRPPPDLAGETELVDSLKGATPPVTVVPTSKVRSQFDFGDAWVEIALVAFPGHSTASVSVHSPSRASVERDLAELQPEAGLELMNYVTACRRFVLQM